MKKVYPDEQPEGKGDAPILDPPKPGLPGDIGPHGEQLPAKRPKIERPQVKTALPGAVTQQVQYGSQLVVDLDFTIQNPIEVVRSFDSNTLFVNLICVGLQQSQPAVDMDDPDTMIFYAADSLSVWRCYISVVPPIGGGKP